MSIAIRQLGPCFFGEVSGVDLRRPLDAGQAAAIEAGMDRYAVLLFRGQDLTDEQQMAFARNFGALEHTAGGHVAKPAERRLDPHMADISNLDQYGRLFRRDDRRRMFNLGNQLWHSDSSYRPVPAKYSALHARAIPSAGGDTQFADMRAAWDTLDDELKALAEPLVCRHSLIYSRGQLGFEVTSDAERAMFAPVRQRLVRTHPVTGRKSLYLSAHIGTIEGWAMPEARAFIRELTERATQPPFTHTHRWAVGDLVMWDNRQTMHRARWYLDRDEVRDMRRTTIAGDAPTIEQAA
jgi:alpha-ketoglutarate-dependent 2,4-dichlorophenoxyacetate dioxygenase